MVLRVAVLVALQSVYLIGPEGMVLAAISVACARGAADSWHGNLKWWRKGGPE